MRTYQRIALTVAVILVAVGAFAFRYLDYLRNPWTRDGQVMANVVLVAPRVSGPIVSLPIRDNQFVNAGDVLFEIDPRTFQAALDQARANFDKTLDDLTALAKQVEASEASVDQYESSISVAESAVKSAEAELVAAKATYDRALPLVEKQDVSRQRFDQITANYQVAIAAKDQADAALLTARSALLQATATLAQARANLGAEGEENAQFRAARAALEEAELNLEFTRVEASVDGYVTNLDLRLGSQAVANQPALALVDVSSYRVDAFFRETLVSRIRPGDRAVMTLMSYPGVPIEGQVDSIGWGIFQQDGSTGPDLLPEISATFEWIRLAERVPVRVNFEDLPEGIDLRVGTTASVLVMTGTSDVDGDNDRPVAALPTVLQ